MHVEIMIVEDNTSLCFLYQTFLDEIGHDVIIMEDGQEVIEFFKNSHQKPDIIIMDHHINGADGLSVMKFILAHDPEARVIFASADATIMREALEIGAVGFLLKPFLLKELEGILQEQELR
ncbi:response regulator [Candidatus Bathyarchaeota archaeon]|nr:response regulator [Candidatus Bathyarchaeota archaeon]